MRYCLAADSEQELAIQALEQLGAIVDLPGSKTARSAPRMYVSIGPKWKGHDADVRHLKVLPEVLTLFVLGKGRVSEKALKQLQNDLPKLKIKRRGIAFFGVAFRIQPEGLLIVRVIPKSLAARSGLQKNDVITKIDAQPIPEIQKFIKLLRPPHPKDVITLTILRGKKTIDITVKSPPPNNAQRQSVAAPHRRSEAGTKNH